MSDKLCFLGVQAEPHFYGRWLDAAQVGRELSQRETLLKMQPKRRYEVLCLQDELYWKVRWLKAGDTNTKFFHIRASCRRNRNYISHLSDGIESLSSPEAIANHLFSFYHSQLGVDFSTRRSIHFHSLYGSESLDLFNLHLPFTMDKVKSAVFSSAPEKAPGPDGIGEVRIHTLQFADDILLFFNGSRKSAAVIKLILDAFFESSGLRINYSKSAIIPIHLTEAQPTDLSTFFGCSTQGF
ncbi:hypothetical protein ACMD2_20650, partial [Ananas comosus]